MSWESRGELELDQKRRRKQTWKQEQEQEQAIRKIHSLHSSLLIEQTTIVVLENNK